MEKGEQGCPEVQVQAEMTPQGPTCRVGSLDCTLITTGSQSCWGAHRGLKFRIEVQKNPSGCSMKNGFWKTRVKAERQVRRPCSSPGRDGR